MKGAVRVMDNINLVLEKGKEICLKLKDKIVKELPEIDMTNSDVQDIVFSEIECNASLELPEFYCCGERCNFEVDLVLEDNDEYNTTLTCSATISGLESFNSYFSDIHNNFSYDNIDKIVDNFFIIIADWTRNSDKQSYLIAFEDPILKESDCIVTKVFASMAGNISLTEIKKHNEYLPKHILACDDVSIIDGSVDQITVVFSADVTDDTPNSDNTVLVFRGFSNFSDRSKNNIKNDLETIGCTINLVELADGETVNDLPIDIYKKLKFCNDKLGIDAYKYVGYTECEELSDFLLEDWRTIYGYNKAVIVNGEPSID